MSPASHVFVVLTAPSAGMEDEFNRWYDEEHVPDVLALPDFAGVRRFRVAPGGDVPLRPYLALYETETDDVPATQARLAAVAGTEAKPFSPAIDMSQAVAWYYEAISEPRTNGVPPRGWLRVALAAATLGREAELERWYAQAWTADVLAIDGIAAARTYRFAPYKPGAESLRPQLAVCEAGETDVTHRVLDRLPAPPALDRATRLTWYFEPIGERVAT